MNIAVIGLGTMGAGIVEVCARAGHRVIAVEADAPGRARARGRLVASTDRAVARAKLTEADRDAALARIEFRVGVGDLGGVEFVIEAVAENPRLKAAIFAELDAAVPADAVLATNTSSLSVTELAAGTAHPERVLGVHFFNPAPVQPLVEVISTLLTAEAVLDRATDLLLGLGKTPVRCGDRAGFIVNALLVPYLNRAATLYQDGFAGRERIDDAMVAAGYPMGPLALADLVGLDVCVAVLERLYAETRDRRHAPAPLLGQLVAAGRLGRKSGRGFYGYESGRPGEDPGPVRARGGFGERGDELPAALLVGYLNDCLRMVEVGYASPADIDDAMALGCAMPRPFDVVAEVGPGALLTAQRALFVETGEPGHRPSLLLERLAEAEDPAAALTQLRGARG